MGIKRNDGRKNGEIKMKEAIKRGCEGNAKKERGMEVEEIKRNKESKGEKKGEKGKSR